MRQVKFPAVICLVALLFVPPACRKKTTAKPIIEPPRAASPSQTARPATPVGAVKEFIAGVAARDKQRITASFSFEKAREDFTAKVKSVGIDNPWTFDQFRDILMYHYLEDEKVRAMQALQAAAPAFTETVDAGGGAALVTITQKNTQGRVVKKLSVTVMHLDGVWRITAFPEFYPINVSKLLTGSDGL